MVHKSEKKEELYYKWKELEILGEYFGIKTPSLKEKIKNVVGKKLFEKKEKEWKELRK